MVAIFTGSGAGLERGSGNVLGGSGLLGSASLGRGGEQVFLNAANGNLVVSRRDEFLVGRGGDVAINRIYNSQGDLSDENGDNWRQSTDREIFDLLGTANSWGSSVKRRSADGSEIGYNWDGTAYVATDGAGAFDRLSFDSAANSWSWTDGDTRTLETYGFFNGSWRIVSERDTSGNVITYSYTGDKLTQIATADGGTIQYSWSGNNIASIVTASQGTTLTRTRYAYDASNRLTTVTVDLSPDDNSVADGKVYTTSYTYHGASRLVATISQTDGTSVAIAYNGANRVSSWTETVASGITRVTSLSYGDGYTIVTDPAGQATRLDYATGDFAFDLAGWSSGNLGKEPASIDGRAATKYTVQTAGTWAAGWQEFSVAAGETLSLAVTLQASGGVTTQDLGLHGNAEQWSTNDIASARILSGPGQLQQTAGGLWRVSGLSATQGTRIEITRTFKQAQTGGAYFYVDSPGGYRAGASLIVADPVLLRSSSATSLSQMDLANWVRFGGATQQSVGTIDGSPAYQISNLQGGVSGATLDLIASAGETFSFSLSLKASGGYTSQTIGLHGNVTAWGSNDLASARIVSGPGTITQVAGGLFTISGLSDTQVTRIEVVRTYAQAESGGPHIYVDHPGGYRVGSSIVAGAPLLTKRLVEPAKAGQLLKVTVPPAQSGAAAQVVEFGYDAKGNLTSVKDAAGNTTSYTHDASGNVLTVTDRLGNTTARTYNATNQLLTETRIGSDKDSAAAAHTTRYVYDGANRLVYTVTAEGKVTRYWYQSTGELYWINGFPDHVYDLSALGAGQAPTQAQLDSWCASLGDTSSSQIASMTFDARGNLTRRVQSTRNDGYAWQSTASGYSEEQFVYDQAGQLLSRRVVGLNTESFVYDGLGRITASTDLNGGTTSFAFNDAATQTVVTLANGLVQTSTYSKAGERVAFTETGTLTAAGTATYKYDAEGRLRMAIDASSVKTYFLYDKVGRKVADVNEAGGVLEYRYDANGRLVAVARYMNGINGGGATTAQLADPNSTLEMAAIRPAAHADDVWTWTVYDKEGRVIETIDGDGSVTAFAYDASSRLVATTGYVNKLAAAQLEGFRSTAPTSPVLPAAHAGDAVSRIFYDKDGRTIGALDGEGYLVRTIYDNAGRKTREIAYANATQSAQRAAGTFQSLIDGAGSSANDRSARYVHDGQGLLRYVIDALGQVTEYGYESAASSGVVIGSLRQVMRYAAPLGALSSYTYAAVKAAIAAAGLPANSANRASYSVYDAAGRLAYAIDAGGAVLAYAYDGSGQLVKEVAYATRRPTSALPDKATMDSWATANPNSGERVTRHYSSADGSMRFTIDAEGYVTRADRDAEGRIIWEGRLATPVSATDAWTIDNVYAAASSTAYVAKSYSYDATGRLAYEYDGEGGVVAYLYRADGSLYQRTMAFGTGDESKTVYLYDAAGRLSTQIDGYGSADAATTGFAYDGLGNLVSTTIGATNAPQVTHYAYDRLGRRVSEIDALNGVTTYGYNAFDEVVRTTDARGYSSYNYYDAVGRVVARQDAENYVTESAYTVFGELASVTRRYKASGPATVGTLPTVQPDAKDATTRFEYDKLGRLTKAIDAETATPGGTDYYHEDYAYDAFGNRTRVTNRSGGITNYSYGKRGLLEYEWVVGPVYDSAGNQTAAGFYKNIYKYDARGNVIQQIEAYGLPERRDTFFTYDKVDRLIEKRGVSVAVGLGTDTAVPIERYAYDKRGNLTEHKDAAGGRTLYYYDDLDRKSAQLSPVGTLGTYTYDATGNLIEARIYADPVALPASPGGTLPTPAGTDYRETRYAYDALGRLLDQSVVAQSAGRWENGTFVYMTGTAADPLLLTTSYQYDAAGNVVKTTDPAGASIYSYYDRLGRKTAQVDQERYLTTWTLDAEGNVLSETRYAKRTTAVPGTAALPAVEPDAADRVTSFTYDRKGNRLTETRVGVVAELEAASTNIVITYSYNALGQVRTKTEANGDTVTYTYDTMGRLIRESRAGFQDADGNAVTPTIRYYYNGLDLLVRTRQGGAAEAAGDRVTRNLYGTGGRLLSTIDAAGATRTYLYDVAGRLVGEYYIRDAGAAGIKTEGVSYRYDLAGNQTRRSVNTITSNLWTELSYVESAYNAFGELVRRRTDGDAGPSDSPWQEQFDYDSAGRLWRTNTGDGVLKFFVYDHAGNQTLALTSASADLSGLTLASYDDSITAAGGTSLAGAITTVSLYSARGELLGTREPDRQLSATTSATLVRARSYNAFGEVASETDARGYTTSFLYNSMGRLLAKVSPQVSVTAETGAVTTVSPTETYGYDLSGRLVAVTDANGNRTTRQLLAGTGHGGSEALVVRELHADSGEVVNGYDVFGDLVDTADEIVDISGAHVRHTRMEYDALGRLVELLRPGGLTEYYAYDVLGQRTRHWTSFDTTNVETTDYDAEGRVVRSQAFGGDVTVTSYQWSATLATAGLGTFGGWIETTSSDADRASAEDGILAAVRQADLFGRVVARTDKGGQAYGYHYDLAGRMATETSTLGGASLRNLAYSYYNGGQIREVVSGDVPVTNTDWSRKIASYEYDALGQLTREKLVALSGDYTIGHWEPPSGGSQERPVDPEAEGWIWVPTSYQETSETLQDGRADYDAVGRITRYRDVLASGADGVDKHWTYDAVGNVRSIATSYRPMLADGSIAGTATSQGFWYRYDSLNRLVTTKGVLVGAVGSGVIQRGEVGTDISYTAAGERRTAQTGTGAEETYFHDAEGRLVSVEIGGVTRAQTGYDQLGRVTSYSEYDASGFGVHSRYGIVYDARGLVLAEKSSTQQGSDWIYTHTVNSYSDTGTGAPTPMISAPGQVGASSGGLLFYSETKNWKNGGGATGYGTDADKDYADSYTSQSYLWRDGAVQSVVQLVNRDGTSSSVYGYDRDGALARVNITGGSRPRRIDYATNLQGQVIDRVEADFTSQSDPHSRTYMFGGRQMGMVGNDGTGNVDYATSIAERTAMPGTGPFRGGASSGTVHADFDANFTALNGGTASAGASSYVAGAGETLQSIAAQLWGDASLWYLLAEANGLSGSATLTAGTLLTIPGGVIGNHHNAATFKPYDPAEAIGNTSPNTPKPPKAKNCGAFGAILMIAVALAVTAIIKVPVTDFVTKLLAAGAMKGSTAYAVAAVAGGVIGGAAVGAAASSASQLFGMATGIQQGGFNWKSVGLAAIASGVMGGLSAKAFGPEASLSIFDKLGMGGNGVLAHAARAVAAEGISQGIGVATRLQSRFDLAGIAAAGVGALAGAEFGGAGLSGRITSIGADSLASAAARSLLTGTDFGDNVLAVLPGVVARSLGEIYAEVVASGRHNDSGLLSQEPEQVNELATSGAGVQAELAALVASGGPSLSDGSGNSYFATADGQVIALHGVATSDGARSGFIEIPTLTEGNAYIRTALSARQINNPASFLLGGYYRINVDSAAVGLSARFAWSEQADGTTGYAVEVDGVIYAIGSNFSGKLGDGIWVEYGGKPGSFDAYWNERLGGQTISSHTPSMFADWKQAARERQQLAYDSWNAGGLGYVAAPFEWVLSPITATLDLGSSYYRGRHGRIAPYDRQTTDIALFAAGGAETMATKLGRASVAAKGTPSLEAAYQARYASAYEEGVIVVDQRLASGQLRAPPGQPPHLYRANQIDAFARNDLKRFAAEQSHGTDLVRINQRLYLEGSSGPYRVPDVYFPRSKTILDGTLGTKTLTTPQIKDFRIATGNAPVGIVRPQSYGGFYWLGN